ncbi:hypothetical protein L1987_19310 [Smallanthus sonchifolius]|uniref:Uncharacterized protein n=1 Tax=Smallanthus sonchifolius TaxID=185202 RepID=A0ACB9IRM4_9ASTR|nr:hypothetical protein L1987_19310 [Smallanthus sonchifolius]
MTLIAMNHAAIVDIKTKGAKGDGITDDGPAILRAWKEACEGPPPSSLLIPPGIYLSLAIELVGPCKGPVEIIANGATIKAPPELAKFTKESWITIRNADKLTVTGGTFDGQGQQAWTTKICKDSTACQIPVEPVMIVFLLEKEAGIFISIEWPVDQDMASIGSLGKYPNEEQVEGIFLNNCTITGAVNGLRIKSWPDSYPGTVNDIHFEDIIVTSVTNPILIDQEYCPNKACKIRGTSAAKVAVKLVCSSLAPCESVEVADINLTFNEGPATSDCTNAKPKVAGQNVPGVCRA